MKGKYDVYIIQVGNEFRVRPAVVSAQVGSDIYFKNTTSRTVMVTIDPPLAGAAQVTLTLDPNDPKGGGGAGKKDKDFVKVQNPCDGGAYSYHVAVQTAPTVPAIGESEPVIIIDP
jgi:hypothetical protein